VLNKHLLIVLIQLKEHMHLSFIC